MSEIIPKFKGGNKLLEGEGGFALLLSLLVLILLVVFILEIDFQTRADLRAAGNFQDDLKAFYLARSAVTAGEALLKDDFIQSNQYDALTELWAYPFPEYPLGDGTLTAAIVDEAGKINLNNLVDANGRSDTQDPKRRQDQLRRLFELLQVDPNLVDPIVDWIDKDSVPLPYGAEEESYQGLNPPYHCKNAPFDTLDELHMVKGITDEIYRKILPYVTIYGGGPNDKININTADPLVLQSLDPGIDVTTANQIMEKRPFDNIVKFQQGFQELNGRMTTANTINWIGVRSDLFSITAEGKVHDTSKFIHAVVRRGVRMQLLYFKVE